MKIVHLSDVHIRNIKCHAEYRRVFENLYRELERIKPDLIVNCGDTAHTKTHISPEYVELCSEFIGRLADLADEQHIILGNHDLNLMNLDRQDAITPIVANLGRSNVFLHKRSGFVPVRPGFNFWVFSLADRGRFPKKEDWARFSTDVNVGLFHGSVESCVTDLDWRMRETETELSAFDGLDYVLLGDIHKQQEFRGGRIAYPGSLIQQNFGEELEKGFLLWDIRGKDDFSVEKFFLDGSRKFYTVNLEEDLSLPSDAVAQDSRVRIVPPRTLTLVEQREVERAVKRRWSPHDVIVLSATSVERPKKEERKKAVDEDDRAAQERMLREFLGERKTDPRIVEKVVELDRRYGVTLDGEESTVRDVEWRIDKIAWKNFFNYGEGNSLEFKKIPGLTGVFAPNGAGKSNLIDVIVQACFDSVTKGIARNVSLINDNKDAAAAVVELTANGRRYVVERLIERVKYGQRKYEEAREWGKTTVGFYSIDDSGEKTQLVGDSRAETERNIRQRLGTFEDFTLTSLLAQWNPADVISCKETRRREVLCRFLGLDVYERKLELSKEESRGQLALLKSVDADELESTAARLRENVASLQSMIAANEAALAAARAARDLLENEILELSSRKTVVELGNEHVGPDRLARIDAEIVALDEKIVREGEAIHVKKSELDLLRAAVARFDVRLHEGTRAELGLVRGRIVELEKSIERGRKAAADHAERIATLDEVPCGDMFPTCKFLVDAFSSKGSLWTVQAGIIESEAELFSLRASLGGLEAADRRFVEHVGRESTIVELAEHVERERLQLENSQLKRAGLVAERARIAELLVRRERAADELARNREIDGKIDRVQARKEEKDRELGILQEKTTEFSRLLGADQGMLEGTIEKIDELKEARELCRAHELYAAAVGKDGIPYRVLTRKLPAINEEINKILANAAEFGVFIEDDPVEQSIRFYLQYGRYKSRLLELAGGAEKMLASIAIRVGLLSVSSLPKTNLFVIDEGFGKLDPERLESVQRMFDYLKTVFDHVVVVSHLDVMKDFVDNQIEISADDEGYAHVET